ncbi:MAG: glycerol-3-phosphate 1-O-acyltransferase PlsY [Alphaproteobacteria bacterium]|jgi:glycerol-3-phosphate acyltransferase PlsY|nr:glycerol-3-phosphate 1-O-acyltransferase PlsY [Alphaproteobacteria bacterium]
MPDPLGSLAFTWPFYAAALFGYLLGSIPFGVVLTRLAGLGDVRRIGSGNIGATNVLRTGKKSLAAAVLLLDGGKGAIAVLLAGMFGPDTAVLAGGGALVGHIFPVWLKFKGGKGVATALGILLAIVFPVGVLACAVWLLVAWLWRYSSLAALVAIGLAPIVAYVLAYVPVFGAYLSDPQRAELALFIAVLVYVRHHGNIRRLWRGEESKIGARSRAEPG